MAFFSKHAAKVVAQAESLQEPVVSEMTMKEFRLKFMRLRALADTWCGNWKECKMTMYGGETCEIEVKIKGSTYKGEGPDPGSAIDNVIENMRVVIAQIEAV